MGVCKNCVREHVWNGDNPNFPFPGECKDCRVGLDGKPTNYQPKPKTNADRIRAMSDEELCKFLGECKFCDICEEGCDSCTYNGDCDKRLLDWLKQPAEE